MDELTKLHPSRYFMAASAVAARPIARIASRKPKVTRAPTRRVACVRSLRSCRRTTAAADDARVRPRDIAYSARRALTFRLRA